MLVKLRHKHSVVWFALLEKSALEREQNETRQKLKQ